MLFMKVKKVRHSQPHWHPPHNKKFVQHICIHPMCWEPLLNKNTVQIRAKFAKNPRTVVGWVGRAFAKNRAKFARSSQHVQAPV